MLRQKLDATGSVTRRSTSVREAVPELLAFRGQMPLVEVVHGRRIGTWFTTSRPSEKIALRCSSIVRSDLDDASAVAPSKTGGFRLGKVHGGLFSTDSELGFCSFVALFSVAETAL